MSCCISMVKFQGFWLRIKTKSETSKPVEGGETEWFKVLSTQKKTRKKEQNEKE